MTLFLAFQIAQTIVCHISIIPPFRFFWCGIASVQHTQWEAKLGGVINHIPSQYCTWSQIFQVSLQCTKRCVVDSSTLLQKTQCKLVEGGIAFRRDKFTLVGIWLSKAFQESATTFDGVGQFHNWTNICLSSSSIHSSCDESSSKLQLSSWWAKPQVYGFAEVVKREYRSNRELFNLICF